MRCTPCHRALPGRVHQSGSITGGTAEHWGVLFCFVFSIPVQDIAVGSLREFLWLQRHLYQMKTMEPTGLSLPWPCNHRKGAIHYLMTEQQPHLHSHPPPQAPITPMTFNPNSSARQALSSPTWSNIRGDTLFHYCNSLFLCFRWSLTCISGIERDWESSGMGHFWFSSHVANRA